MELLVVKGDITEVQVDAIVNAANTSLLGGGGVDGAIHRAAGPALLEECKAIRNRQGGCKVGEAVITNAGSLKAKKVIHTVGPKWNQGFSNEAVLLESCYLISLQLAEENKLECIAFPNISTGIYGYPKEAAAEIAIAAVRAHQAVYIKTVTFVCFDKENYHLYLKLLS